MTMLPTLYAYDKTGRIKEWSVEFNSLGTYTVTHGLQTGKKQKKLTICEGKNIGKSNETTAYKQAKLEATAKWTKQKDKNYHEVLDTTTEQLILPMLAKDFRKEGHRIEYPADVLPKLDGVRCFVYKDSDGSIKYKSRGGKFYPEIIRISEELKSLFDVYPDITLDGELYVHGELLQDIISAVKKPKTSKDLDKIRNKCDTDPSMDNLEGLRSVAANIRIQPNIKFYVFDCHTNGAMDWVQRKIFYSTIVKDHCHRISVIPVEFVTIHNKTQVKYFHDIFVNIGYEGVMVRNHNGIYELNTRSHNLQKYKEFMDSEFTVVEIVEGDDKTGIPLCITECGKTFKATYKNTTLNKKLLLINKDKYIGKQLNVKYQALSSEGIPIFPIGIRFREKGE